MTGHPDCYDDTEAHCPRLVGLLYEVKKQNDQIATMRKYIDSLEHDHGQLSLELDRLRERLPHKQDQ